MTRNFSENISQTEYKNLQDWAKDLISHFKLEKKFEDESCFKNIDEMDIYELSENKEQLEIIIATLEAEYLHNPKQSKFISQKNKRLNELSKKNRLIRKFKSNPRKYLEDSKFMTLRIISKIFPKK